VPDAIEAVGATLLFFLPYSLDFNPFARAFSKLKARLRKKPQCARYISCGTPSVESSTSTLPRLPNYFAASGYGPLTVKNAQRGRLAPILAVGVPHSSF
jgi:hypothetical protein